jgi:hypothetical protein
MEGFDRLDRAIDRRFQMEDAFIQAMVQELTAIKSELDTCTENLRERDEQLRQRGQSTLQQTPNPAQDLSDLSQRLGVAIQRLRSDPPLNEANLDPMIDKVLREVGRTRAAARNPFLKPDPSNPNDPPYPPNGDYPYTRIVPASNPSAAPAVAPTSII